MVELFDYQLEYLKNMPKNIIMAADVGQGKTLMAIEHARRHNPAGRPVVIAPASKVRTKDWDREIKLSYAPNSTPEYEVISYEMFTKRWTEFYDSEVTLIIDEGHMACNATSKRSKAILKVASVAYQWIILSATPLPNGWKSAGTYAILTHLAKNKTAFVRRFEIWERNAAPFPIFMGYREVSTLEAWWATIAKPLARTGAQRLPSENIPVALEMTPALARVYRKAKNDRIYNGEMLDNPSKTFVTLRQIPTPTRIDALHNVLNSTDEHVVVFYNFDAERVAMHELLATKFKDRVVYEQSGHASHLPEREQWGKLKPSVTLAQYQSAAQAIELTYASVTVYLSPPTSYSNYEQSKGRTRRHGQKKTTLFYHVAIEGSLDRHIWTIVKDKQEFSTALMRKLLDN